MADKKWIQGAIKRKGALKAAAQRAGKSTLAYAKSILAKGRKGANTRRWHQAHLYVNVLRRLGKRRAGTRKRAPQAKRKPR